MQVCECMQSVQHRGSAAYQARSSPVRHAALLSPTPEWLQGYTKAIHKTRGLNCPCMVSVHCTTHHGGQQLQAQPPSAKVNSKQQKHINVTYVAVCRPPKAPRCAPALPCSTSCLCCCCSPSSIQGSVWSLVKLGVKVGP